MCQWALTEREAGSSAGRQAHLSDVSAGAEVNSLLSTIAPGMPTPKPSRSSSVMLFSRSEMSGIPQKLVSAACSITALARWSAASPVMPLLQRLCHRSTHAMVWEAHSKGMGRICERGGLP